MAAQSAQIGVAEADLYPTIFINGTLGWDAENFSQAFSTKSFLGLLMPGFRWNILNYGRILNNVRLQEARLQELIATYQSQVLSAGREVQVPLRGFLKSREQAEDLARSVTAAAAATEVGVAQYRTGTIDFNRVFNLETTQVQQQDRLATAQGDIALNLIAVYRAFGGGWELRLQKDPSPRRCRQPTRRSPQRLRAMRRSPRCRERRNQEEESHDENARSRLWAVVLAVMTARSGTRAESPATWKPIGRTSSGDFDPSAAGTRTVAACSTGGTRIAFPNRAGPTTTAASQCRTCAGRQLPSHDRAYPQTLPTAPLPTPSP